MVTARGWGDREDRGVSVSWVQIQFDEREQFWRGAVLVMELDIMNVFNTTDFTLQRG